MNAVDIHRVGRWFHDRGLRLPARVCEKLIFLLYNSWLPVEVDIGPRTELAYGGMGVVVHKDVKIGEHVLVCQHVTIGGRSHSLRVPVIEDECYLGPGSAILGAITVGKGSIVGANAVVLADVPPRSIVAGVPARVIRRDIVTEHYYPGPSPEQMAESPDAVARVLEGEHYVDAAAVEAAMAGLRPGEAGGERSAQPAAGARRGERSTVVPISR
jgi:serine O-acetyltransferase